MKKTNKLFLLVTLLSLSGLFSCGTNQTTTETTVETTTQVETDETTTKHHGGKTSSADEDTSTEEGTTDDVTTGDEEDTTPATSYVTETTYTATEEDESAFEASSGTYTFENTAFIKSDGGASSADDSSFKGLNAAVRVYGTADVTLKECTVEATASNATGVFAYDNGVVHIEDSTVNVTGGGAGGVQVAGGGTLYGTNLTVTSKSKAAIRSDRGGGTLVIDKGTYTSLGTNGCPAIYSTADITVKNATCTSEQSRAVIIEGKNSVTLDNCIMEGNDQSSKTGSVKANVLLYQSASGDAAEGTSVFNMANSQMKTNSGAMFYCTNTASVVTLENNTFTLSTDDTFLTVSEGRWGSDGKNGGTCTLNCTNQTFQGAITVDSISTLDMTLNASNYTGAINTAGTAGDVEVTLDADSTWNLTGNSYVTTFNRDYSNVVANGYHLYVNGTQKV